MTARALVVAAPASGSGKTTVATGLMAALRRRGTAVAPFKVGPDYIDPGYHTLAAGLPGRNLDPVLVGADRIAPLARHGAAGAEVAVVEGVMGLFDGRLADGRGSTAEVAGLLGAPVVLVVDARGQSRSLAALLHGFRSFDPAVDLAGVVLNRVGSPRHEEVLRAAAAEVGLPVLGALPRREALAVPSRHLGLVTAAEHGIAATAAVDAMAELVAAHVDLDAVVALARPLPPGPAWSPDVVRGRTAPSPTAPTSTQAPPTRAPPRTRPALAGSRARTGRARSGRAAGAGRRTRRGRLHLRLRRARRAAGRRGGGGRGRRPAARHPPPGRHGRARAARRLPRGARRRARGQRRTARGGAGARRLGRARARRVRRPALPVRHPRRRARCATSCPPPRR